MDPRCIYFPGPKDVKRHALAFAKMMFAHAAFEREVRELQAAVTCEQGYGEKRENQWSAHLRPNRMETLIKKQLGAIPEVAPIKKFLTEAITVCDDRNFLAHGEWWCFDPDAAAIDVRGGTQWKHGRVDYRQWTAAQIDALAEKFKDLEAELYKLRRTIEQRNGDSGLAPSGKSFP
jgi:hypothetical protein